MKFQKNNATNAVTKEYYLKVEKEKAQVHAQKRKAIKERENYVSNKLPMADRKLAYPSIEDQLDLLWHDVDAGKIQADTTSANTWYQTIKGVKENNPLPK
jgi:hypothetical protein